MKAKGEGGYLIWKMNVLMVVAFAKSLLVLKTGEKSYSSRIHTVLTRTMVLFLDIVENGLVFFFFFAFFSDFIFSSLPPPFFFKKKEEEEEINPENT